MGSSVDRVAGRVSGMSSGKITRRVVMRRAALSTASGGGIPGG